MDWDWKEFPWDSIELEPKEDSSLASLVDSSSLAGQKNRGGGLMVDLKLGRISDLEERSAAGLKDLGASTMVSSPSGSSKRARVLGGTQSVLCLVDGCKSDLSNCRDYHRRHRVCERHSKTPAVIVGGKEQRFCQQCSRFHSLGEFDEVKRSCRKRLDGHNMRRRKSQSESLYLSSEKFLSNNYKGTRILQFCSPHICASGTTTMRSTWPGIPRSEAESKIYNSQQRLHITDRKRSPNSFAFIFNEEDKLFSFSQENGTKLGTQAVPKASFYQSLPNSIASSESGRGNNNMSSSGMTQSIDLGCALYLLSSPPTSQTSAVGLSQLVQSSVSHPIQSLDSGQQLTGVAQYSCSQGVRDKSAGLVFVPDANETNMYCNDMLFQGALDALLENEAS